MKKHRYQQPEHLVAGSATSYRSRFRVKCRNILQYVCRQHAAFHFGQSANHSESSLRRLPGMLTSTLFLLPRFSLALLRLRLGIRLLFLPRLLGLSRWFAPTFVGHFSLSSKLVYCLTYLS